MGRKILFITTDQMRYDALGCNGGQVARTPCIDRLAAEGINYRRAHNQSVVCMPARATIVTGQHVATHGVWMNGVALPEDTPTVAHWLQQRRRFVVATGARSWTWRRRRWRRHDPLDQPVRAVEQRAER